jgi:hypothetical protein
MSCPARSRAAGTDISEGEPHHDNDPGIGPLHHAARQCHPHRDVVALEEHGFSVEVVDDLDAARTAVLARLPRGSSVMTNTSVTLQETGLEDAINNGGPYESARQKMLALDFATQAQEMKAIGGQPEYALGSVHVVLIRQQVGF